ARILYQGHKENYWQITSNGGEQLKKKLDVETDRGPWLLEVEGFSELGISTRLPNENKKELFRKAEEIFTKRNKDYALLIDHIDRGRDWFITEDRDFLRYADQLQPNILVLQSFEAVERIIQERIIYASDVEQLLRIVS